MKLLVHFWDVVYDKSGYTIFMYEVQNSTIKLPNPLREKISYGNEVSHIIGIDFTHCPRLV